MNHHFRSYSEQQQPLRPHHQPSHLVNGNGAANTNGNGSANSNGNTSGNNPVNMPDRGSLNGIIRIHSDSQQSLDRLFNPPNTQATVPLRNRNLPASFFNPSWQTNANKVDQDLADQRQQQNSLHSRSTSFDHRPGMNHHLASHHQPGSAHMRTQSTQAPMTGSIMGPSRPVINGTSVNGNLANGQSANLANAPMPNSQQQQQLAPLPPSNPPSQNGHQLQPPIAQQRNNHCRNFSGPAFMSSNNNTNGTPHGLRPQANHFYSPSHVNSTINSPPSIDYNTQPQANMYYGMETGVSVDANMTDANFTQQLATIPAADYQPQEYFSSSSSSDQDLPASARQQQQHIVSPPSNPQTQNGHQLQAPMPQLRSNHCRNFSGPAFLSTNNNTNGTPHGLRPQANHFYSPSHVNSTINSPPSIDYNTQPQANMYYGMETGVSVDSNMTDAGFTTALPSADYQANASHDCYASSGSSNQDLPTAAPEQQQTFRPVVRWSHLHV